MKTGVDSATIVRVCAAAVAMCSGGAAAHADDHPNSCEQATHWPIAFGGSPLSGVLDSPEDVDVLSLELAPGQLYRFNVWSGEGPNWVRVRVLAPGCGPARAEWLPLEPLSANYWFLAPERDPLTGKLPRLVAMIDAPFGTVGEYRIPIERVGGPYTDDYPSSRAEAKQVVPGAFDIRGELEFGNDRDVFTFAARVGGMYRVEIIEGREVGGRLAVRLDAEAAAGMGEVTATAPAQGCDFKPDGCSIARIVVPPPASGAPARVFVTVQNGAGDDDSLAARPYVIRLIDEGEFVPVQGSAACNDGHTPAISLGVPIALDPPMSTWTTQTLAAPITAGCLYRLVTTALIGEPRLSIAIADGECEHTLGYIQPEWEPAIYFRAPASGAAKLTVGRTEVLRDSLDQPLPGACIVQLDNLGPIGDDHPDVLPDHPDPTLSAGGRIERAMLEYSDDRDVFMTEFAANTLYRIEARPMTGGGGLRVLAFGLDAAGSASFATFDTTGVFSGQELRLTNAGRVAIEVRSAGPRTRALPEPQAAFELRVIRVGCRGDWNGSGERDVDDLYAYLADYFDSRGEFDGLGQIASVSDLLGFVQAWMSPCD